MAQISNDTLAFLKQLSQNNNKDWFDQNKKQWESVKENYASFINHLQDEIKKIDDIQIKEPKRYISRINRDIRFSVDKSPYRNNIFSLFERNASFNIPKFYIHVEPGNSHVIAGLWAPDTETLNLVRKEIEYNDEEFTSIINNPDFIKNFSKLSGESLSKPPIGFSKDSKNLEYLKMKQFFVRKEYTDSKVISSEFINEIVNDYKLVLPLFNFLTMIEK